MPATIYKVNIALTKFPTHSTKSSGLEGVRKRNYLVIDRADGRNMQAEGSHTIAHLALAGLVFDS